jgi:hypothetical protein
MAISISELSHTISELIDLDPQQQSLMASAIDRALDARQIVGGTSVAANTLVAGGIMPTPPKCEVPVLINGTIAVPPNCPPRKPRCFPIGKIAD